MRTGECGDAAEEERENVRSAVRLMRAISRGAQASASRVNAEQSWKPESARTRLTPGRGVRVFRTEITNGIRGRV